MCHLIISNPLAAHNIEDAMLFYFPPDIVSTTTNATGLLSSLTNIFSMCQYAR
jgi:hypothetical protein